MAEETRQGAENATIQYHSLMELTAKEVQLKDDLATRTLALLTEAGASSVTGQTAQQNVGEEYSPERELATTQPLLTEELTVREMILRPGLVTRTLVHPDYLPGLKTSSGATTEFLKATLAPEFWTLTNLLIRDGTTTSSAGGTDLLILESGLPPTELYLA